MQIIVPSRRTQTCIAGRGFSDVIIQHKTDCRFLMQPIYPSTQGYVQIPLFPTLDAHPQTESLPLTYSIQ